MSAADADSRIRGFINEEFGVDPSQEIGVEESLLGGGFVDSMGILALVDFIETDFAVEIADDDLVATNFESIAAIRDFVARKNGDAASAA